MALGFFFVTAIDRLEEKIGDDSIGSAVPISSMNLGPLEPTRATGPRLKSRPYSGERGEF
jgi:hypothetical protein